MLIDSRYEDTGLSMSDQQILDEALIIFVAGHETTANSLAWTLYLLRHQQKHIALIGEEAKEVQKRPLSIKSLMEADYWQKVIQESLRLYPPAWILDRTALNDEEINGVEIKKGDLLGLYTYGAHRSSKYWNDVNDFDPERFEKSRVKQRHNYAFFPFGGGPRLCIGQHFAIMEMQLALYSLLTKFKFDALTEDHPVLQPLITLRPKGGIPMKIKLIPAE